MEQLSILDNFTQFVILENLTILDLALSGVKGFMSLGIFT